MDKHSPGPWSIIKSSGRLAIWDATQAPVAYPAVGTESNDADARLIAAAPDLLKVAQWVVGKWKNGHHMPPDLLLAAREAIVLATDLNADD